MATDRGHFVSLPEPPTRGEDTISARVDDEYLRELENYIGAIHDHLIAIQKEEAAVRKSFSDALKAIASKPDDKNAQDDEADANVIYEKDMKRIKQRRRKFRELLYDAYNERKKLIEAMKIQRTEEEVLRRKLQVMSAEDQAPSEKLPSWDLFFFAFLALQGFTIFAFWLATDFADTTVGNTGGPNSTDDYFSYYNHIALMVFVGFAFLYTFLRKYAYSAMGYTFLAVIVAFEWTILVNVFFDGADRDDYFRTDLTIWQLIEGLYGSLAVLISFGAFLGRVSPLVLIFVAWIEPLFFGIVRYLVLLQLNCVDIAGTMHVHIFGAYFGLAVSYFMSMPFLGKGVTDVATFARDRLPSYTSNITAFLGTLLIFVAFPSFNAVHSDDDSQFRVIINTVLALTTSGAFAFITSRTLRGGKFFMADVQNGVLAGGIIVGSATTVVVSPGGAMVVGAVGGIATVVANAYLTPVLERKGIVDVAGVHNLHGIPGLLGALGGIASSAIVGDDDLIYGQPATNVLPEGEDQPGYQTAGLFISLGIGLGGGFIVGLFVFFINRVVEKLRSSLVLKTFFSDEAGWFVPTDFERTEGEAV